MIGYPSLDHLRIFASVAETGSFSAAATRLNRAQSVISYAIATLEEQLGGIPLFDRSARRPVLTAAGQALLADAREIVLAVETMRAKARGIGAGLEPEVVVAVDVMLPSAILTEALNALRAAYPGIGLRLFVEALGAVADRVLSGQCAIGITGPLPDPPDLLELSAIGSVELVPVAAPSHPLAQIEGPITQKLLRGHVQLVLTDRSPFTAGRDFAVASLETWRLGDLGAKHDLLLAGLGWGNMPRAMIADDLLAGRLVILLVKDGDALRYPLSSIARSDTPPGPVARWLVDQIANRLRGH